MNFELGKEYIVRVTEKGIIPIDEFDRARFFDKDCDSLEFLTDEEKTEVINNVLDNVKAEIEKHQFSREYCCDHNIDSAIDMSMVRIILDNIREVDFPQAKDIEPTVENFSKVLDNKLIKDAGTDMRGDNIISEREKRNREIIINMLKDMK